MERIDEDTRVLTNKELFERIGDNQILLIAYKYENGFSIKLNMTENPKKVLELAYTLNNVIDIMIKEAIKTLNENDKKN